MLCHNNNYSWSNNAWLSWKQAALSMALSKIKLNSKNEITS